MTNSEQVDVVIPAQNEEDTVGKVVETLISSRRVSRVIVVDHNSQDRTADVAQRAGALTISCSRAGLGNAVKAGIRVATTQRILRTDADIKNWDVAWLDKLLQVRNTDLVRATFVSPYDDLPVTRLVAEPLLQIVFPLAPRHPLPLSGTYVFYREAFDLQNLGDDWSFDISLLCEALRLGVLVENVEIGILSDRERPLSHYVPMATEIMKYMLRQGGD